MIDSELKAKSRKAFEKYLEERIENVETHFENLRDAFLAGAAYGVGLALEEMKIPDHQRKDT